MIEIEEARKTQRQYTVNSFDNVFAYFVAFKIIEIILSSVSIPQKLIHAKFIQVSHACTHGTCWSCVMFVPLQ